MSELTVKQVFPLTNGIIHSISVAGEYDFSEDMDLLLISKCGQRQITPIVEMLLDSDTTLSQDKLDRLAAIILVEYKDAWDRVKNALQIEYNPISASQYRETETIESEGTTGNTSNETSQRGIATADTVPSNYVSDDKNTSESTDTGTNTNSSSRVLERTSNGTSYKSSDLITSELDMRLKRRFMSQVLDDVKNYIAMQIY